MARLATEHHPGRAASIVRSLVPSPDRLAVTLAVEVYLLLVVPRPTRRAASAAPSVSPPPRRRDRSP